MRSIKHYCHCNMRLTTKHALSYLIYLHKNIMKVNDNFTELFNITIIVVYPR